MVKAVILDWVGTVHKRNIGLFEETIPVLEELKHRGYVLGLVSLAGQGIPIRTQEIKDSGIAKYFDSIIVDNEKESLQFERCMEELGSAPEETYVVGDRTKREIRVGNSLGCKTYWIQRGRYSEEIPTLETGEPDGTISSLREFLNFA